jgi:hypothetical protein
VSLGFASVSDLSLPCIAASVKPRSLGWPAFHHRTTMMGRSIPRKRTRAAKQCSQQVCGNRINYAKLKEDKEFKEPRSLSKRPEVDNTQDQNLNRSAEEHQGQCLTDAPVRPIAPMRRWAGVLMSTNGFENAPDLASALGIALKNNGKSSFRIDYERYRAFFDDQTISDEQKDQLIEMLFTIGHAFYDAGFAYEFANVNSSQACGKHEETQDDSAACGQDVLSSRDITLSKKFNLCAAE